MKVLLLVNPYASGVTAKKNDRIRKLLRQHFTVVEKFTAERGHATELAREAAANGTEVVFTLGGDGTINEVVNGLCGSDTALAPLPGGSTNVFARSIGLRNQPIHATKQLIPRLLDGEFKSVGVGQVNGRRFIFHAGIGFDAAVVREVEGRGDLKRWLSNPLYIAQTIRVWGKKYDHRAKLISLEQLEPTADGETEETAQTPAFSGPMCLIMNTNPYTYLGSLPLSISHDANLDSELVLVGIRSMKAHVLLRLVGKALRGNGRVTRDKAVLHLTGQTGFTLTSQSEIPWQLDGDLCGESDRWEFSFEADSLRLLTPK